MTTEFSDLNGLFKEAYADGVENLIPECNKILRKVKFSEGKFQNGNLYHQPVVVRQEHGVTYAAPGSGAFSTNAARSMATQDAQVAPYQILLEAALDYETLNRAKNNSFMEATEIQVSNAVESVSKRLELACLYGRSGLGVADSSSNVDSTSTVVTLTVGSWAVGIWAGMENAQIQFFATSDGSLVSSGADSIFTISAVDPDDRTLTVTGTATGITALDTQLASGDADIFFNGARTGASAYSEMVGLDAIITNTGSLFNIDAATYNLWKGNNFAVGSAALTRAKVWNGLTNAVSRGLSEDVDLYVNPRTWSNIAEGEASLRQYDSSFSSSTSKNGSVNIEWIGPTGAKVSLVPHPYVKQGEAFAIPMKKVKRIGSKDVGFKLAGDESDYYVYPLNGQAGFGYRVYTAQSVFLETPAKATKFTGITNT